MLAPMIMWHIELTAEHSLLWNGAQKCTVCTCHSSNSLAVVYCGVWIGNILLKKMNDYFRSTSCRLGTYLSSRFSSSWIVSILATNLAAMMHELLATHKTILSPHTEVGYLIFNRAASFARQKRGTYRSVKCAETLQSEPRRVQNKYNAWSVAGSKVTGLLFTDILLCVIICLKQHPYSHKVAQEDLGNRQRVYVVPFHLRESFSTSYRAYDIFSLRSIALISLAS